MVFEEQTCIGEVALDKWFPLNAVALFEEALPRDAGAQAVAYLDRLLLGGTTCLALLVSRDYGLICFMLFVVCVNYHHQSLYGSKRLKYKCKCCMLLVFVCVCVKYHHTSLHYSKLLKSTCVRQVIPPIIIRYIV